MLDEGVKRAQYSHWSVTFTTLPKPVEDHMISYEDGIYVRIEEVTGQRAPTLKPLESGFDSDHAYRVLGIFNPSETAEAYLIMSNERDELWFISNRHVRTVGIVGDGPFRLPLTSFVAET